MDYQKLNKKIVWIILGWSTTVLLLNFNDYIRWRDSCHDSLQSTYLTFMLNHCCHINIMNDLIFANILRYFFLYIQKPITLILI